MFLKFCGNLDILVTFFFFYLGLNIGDTFYLGLYIGDTFYLGLYISGISVNSVSFR